MNTKYENHKYIIHYRYNVKQKLSKRLKVLCLKTLKSLGKI